MIDIDTLERLAKAAEWTGEWYYAGCNTVECRYASSAGDLCDEIAHPVPLNVAPFIAAANPAAILELIVEVRRLRDIADEQSYDLMGVVADVEQGNGFDEICLATIKSAIAELSKARKEKA